MEKGIIGVYPIMTLLFGVDVIQLGLYLPLLVVEPLIIKRYERPDQKGTFLPTSFWKPAHRVAPPPTSWQRFANIAC